MLERDRCPPARRSAHPPANGAAGLYRSVVEQSQDAMFVYARGRFLYLNPAASRLLGASSPSDLIGRNIYDLGHPEDRAAAAERARLGEGGLPLPTTLRRMVRLDGREIEVEIAGAPITYEGCPAVYTVVRDNTARRDRGRALERSEARYHALVDGLPDVTYTADPVTGVTLWVSPQVSTVLGYTPEDFVRTPRQISCTSTTARSSPKRWRAASAPARPSTSTTAASPARVARSG
ncbi:MAG: PAS domain S-box protein [Alphaproteobacteria bacterium]|nr:PAS domain S-box protein [Alphaproteobacteria bacterium]